ncbi:hypothetical protein L1887_58375 [Cichorium endivia]|nr:hypothetical protein L1887_58375 [Cichorium endivia]
MRENSPEAASVEGSSEPSRKKRKHVRGKVQIQPDVGVSRPPSKIVESKATSESRPGPASATPTSPPIASAANRDRNVASSSTIPRLSRAIRRFEAHPDARRDFYRTNQSLIDAIVAEGSKKVEAKPEAYAIVPGTIDRDHLEDVAKDLMDSARSGFRMSLRTGLQAEKEDKEKHEKYRGVERAKTKCRNREIGAGRLRHAIPKQLLIPGAYSDDAASDEDLHGLTKSEWKRQRLRKLRIAKGWEAVTPKWRNKHLTRAYHKADIVSKSKQMARWRRDDPVDLPIPIKLYGKLLPKQLFDPDWLAEHRKELEEEPYCIRINDNDIDGWEESHHPLGEDTSDEMEWSDAKESSLRGRQLTSAPSSSRDRGSNTQSPAPVAGSSSVPITRSGEDSKGGSSTPVLQASSSALAASEAAQPETDKAPESKTLAQTASEAEATSSISGSSRSGNVDTADTGDTGASESESDVSTTDKPPPHPPKPTPCQCPIRSILLSPSDLLNTVQLLLPSYTTSSSDCAVWTFARASQTPSPSTASNVQASVGAGSGFRGIGLRARTLEPASWLSHDPSSPPRELGSTWLLAMRPGCVRCVVEVYGTTDQSSGVAKFGCDGELVDGLHASKHQQTFRDIRLQTTSIIQPARITAGRPVADGNTASPILTSEVGKRPMRDAARLRCKARRGPGQMGGDDERQSLGTHLGCWAAATRRTDADSRESWLEHTLRDLCPVVRLADHLARIVLTDTRGRIRLDHVRERTRVCQAKSPNADRTHASTRLNLDDPAGHATLARPDSVLAVEGTRRRLSCASVRALPWPKCAQHDRSWRSRRDVWQRGRRICDAQRMNP